MWSPPLHVISTPYPLSHNFPIFLVVLYPESPNKNQQEPRSCFWDFKTISEVNTFLYKLYSINYFDAVIEKQNNTSYIKSRIILFYQWTILDSGGWQDHVVNYGNWICLKCFFGWERGYSLNNCKVLFIFLQPTCCLLMDIYGKSQTVGFYENPTWKVCIDSFLGKEREHENVWNCHKQAFVHFCCFERGCLYEALAGYESQSFRLRLLGNGTQGIHHQPCLKWAFKWVEGLWWWLWPVEYTHWYAQGKLCCCDLKNCDRHCFFNAFLHPHSPQKQHTHVKEAESLDTSANKRGTSCVS